MNKLVVLLKNTSIRSKIFIFYSIILLVALSTFATLNIRISNQAIVDKATKNAERELALINKSLLNLETITEDYIRRLSTEDRLQTQLEILNDESLDLINKLDVERVLAKVISNVVTPNTHFAAASIISNKQKFFDIGYFDISSVASVFNKKLLSMITYDKTPVWTGLVKMRYRTGVYENVFAIAKTIIGVDTGNILGTAVIYLKEEDIAAIYLDNIISQNDKFYILDSNNHIMSTQDKSELYTKFQEKKYLGQYKLSEIPNSRSIISNIGGNKSLITVQDYKQLSWKIVSIIPMDEITNENKRITNLIVIICLICLLFAFTISYFLSYTVSKPILKLVQIMKEIKSGNMSLRADFTLKDEIGMLGEGFNSLMDRINDLLNQIYAEQKLKRENEFKLMQSQIKPHFLYNTLETIISFIKLGLNDNAVLTAKNLAGFYRVSLSKGNDVITIKDEMQLIENYLSLQKLRYTEYLDYKLEIDEDILKYQIPKLTLQPLVENSIYHGLKQKENKGMLIVKGFLDNDQIKIEVFDDGVGMSEEQITKVMSRPVQNNKSTDFGLYNVDSRLRLLYGEQYGLAIESSVNEFTRVTVKLPIYVQ